LILSWDFLFNFEHLSIFWAQPDIRVKSYDCLHLSQDSLLNFEHLSIFWAQPDIQVKRYVMQFCSARALDRRLQVEWASDAREGPRVLMSFRVDFGPNRLSMNPLIFVDIRLKFHYFWALYIGLRNIGRVPLKCRIFQPLYFRAPRLVFVLGLVL